MRGQRLNSTLNGRKRKKRFLSLLTFFLFKGKTHLFITLWFITPLVGFFCLFVPENVQVTMLRAGKKRITKHKLSDDPRGQLRNTAITSSAQFRYLLQETLSLDLMYNFSELSVLVLPQNKVV